jgi:hypothetical protein
MSASQFQCQSVSITIALAIGIVSWLGPSMTFIGAKKTTGGFSSFQKSDSEPVQDSGGSPSVNQEDEAFTEGIDVLSVAQGARASTTAMPMLQTVAHNYTHPSQPLIFKHHVEGVARNVTARSFKPSLRAMLEPASLLQADDGTVSLQSRKPDDKKAGEDPKKNAASTTEEANKCQEGRHPDAEGNCNTECPDNTVNKKPDEKGNCQCKENFVCFDSRIVDEGVSLAKELKPENGKVVKETVTKDQVGKPSGCPMHAHALTKGETAEAASVSSSDVYFQRGCEHCKCKAKDGTSTVSLHAAAFFVLIATMLS